MAHHNHSLIPAPPPPVSFAPLAAHFPALQHRLAGGDRCLGEFCALVQARAAAERAYAEALQKIGHMPCGDIETGSLAEAIDAIKCDALNHSRASSDFARQLNEEVLQPAMDCRRVYRSMNGKQLQKAQKALDEFGRVRTQAAESRRRLGTPKCFIFFYYYLFFHQKTGFDGIIRFR